MTTVQKTVPITARPPLQRRAAGWLALGLVATFLAAFGVLSSAIDWPSSLDLAPAEALPLVAAETPGLLAGYWLYFAYSFGLAPLAVLLPVALGARSGPLATLVVVTGVVSAAFRCFGITRWLVAMPTLAETYVSAAPGSPTRAAAVVVYSTVNDHGGGVGEILGVTLTGAALAVLVTVLVIRTGGPWWLGALGLLAALSLLAGLVVELFVTWGAVAFLAWLLGLAAHLLRAQSTRKVRSR